MNGSEEKEMVAFVRSIDYENFKIESVPCSQEKETFEYAFESITELISVFRKNYSDFDENY